MNLNLMKSYKNEINNLLEKLNSAFSEIAELSTIAKNLTKALREARDQLQSGNEDDTSKFMDSLEDIKEKNNQLKFRISELEKQLEDARKQAQRLMNSVPGDSGMVDMLRTTIKELEEELNKIKQENKELDEITTTLDEQLKQLTKNIRHKNSVTKKKMETIYKTYEVCKSKQIHSLLLLEDMLNSKQKREILKEE